MSRPDAKCGWCIETAKLFVGPTPEQIRAEAWRQGMEEAAVITEETDVVDVDGWDAQLGDARETLANAAAAIRAKASQPATRRYKSHDEHMLEQAEDAMFPPEPATTPAAPPTDALRGVCGAVHPKMVAVRCGLAGGHTGEHTGYSDFSDTTWSWPAERHPAPYDLTRQCATELKTLPPKRCRFVQGHGGRCEPAATPPEKPKDEHEAALIKIRDFARREAVTPRHSGACESAFSEIRFMAERALASPSETGPKGQTK